MEQSLPTSWMIAACVPGAQRGAVPDTTPMRTSAVPLLIRKWTPLPEVVATPALEAFVGEGLYRVRNRLLLQVSQSRVFGQPADPEGPFVIGILVAPDEGAAFRAVARAIETDLPPVFSPPLMSFLAPARIPWG